MIDRWKTSAALVVLILAAGCSRTDNEPGPGGVTVSEAKALDDAAEMLESRDSLPVSDEAPAAKDAAK
ncbi:MULTISPECIES: hypothetical protein [unclassified Sphingopyxis]|jgi:hypothetical protein|uniref:hypothetical protein n=1 Tax=unclassified Sphingopyxis TaxID=2614943 RepID=UPI0006BEE4A6|nr:MULTISPECIES: hypothetical protein [unclassified Sphingopyxis]USI77566.1 hypothetical protein KEC45_01185 [Sphingopyxis sp. USTB-05]GAO79941.1 hypothetical protein SC1_03264 [Sphingopyxis sp. C-1]